MKKVLILLSLAIFAVSCTEKTDIPGTNTDPADAFDVTPPAPTEGLARLSLSVVQQRYVQAGNNLSFKLLKQLARETATTYVCSPLSLQFALAMLANGTAGETQAEILAALGYGEDGLTSLNQYAKILIDQLPALDLDVTIRPADALLVTDQYPLKAAFGNTLRDFYYAPATSLSFSDGNAVMDLVNDWASRSTEGLINPMLDQVDPNTVALLLNALYFKAKWQEIGGAAMFDPDATASGPFYRAGGNETTVSYMTTTQSFHYADMGKYEIVSIPYASGKFYMHILLPKDNNLYPMLDDLVASSWGELSTGLAQESKRVKLYLPKFDITGDFNLNIALGGLGIHRIFDETKAQFDPMFDVQRHGFYVSRVLQKARLSMAEWGTEAAAVTAVEVTEKSMPDPDVTIKADHPFLFLIAGTGVDAPILFGGVYTGV